jgi:hypothetical protein
MDGCTALLEESAFIFTYRLDLKKWCQSLTTVSI